MHVAKRHETFHSDYYSIISEQNDATLLGLDQRRIQEEVSVGAVGDWGTTSKDPGTWRAQIRQADITHTEGSQGRISDPSRSLEVTLRRISDPTRFHGKSASLDLWSWIYFSSEGVLSCLKLIWDWLKLLIYMHPFAVHSQKSRDKLTSICHPL